MRKPRLFIASSVESLPIAEAINVNLDYDFEVTIWKGGTFRLSSSTIDDLVKKSSAVDFALFIFTPDDIVLIRDEKKRVVRDNVLFELGLFVGAIGKDRSFIIKPRSVDLHLPTDLLGVNTTDYESDRSDDDLVSATNRPCSLIKQEAKNKGIINNIGTTSKRRLRANPESYELNEYDFECLSMCSSSYTNDPDGLRFNAIIFKLQGIPESQLRISAIKLERMGYVEKTIETDHQDGYDFYAYKITEDGISALLNSERSFDTSSNQNVTSDDDIPF
jgi:hypothetical protein